MCERDLVILWITQTARVRRSVVAHWKAWTFVVKIIVFVVEGFGETWSDEGKLKVEVFAEILPLGCSCDVVISCVVWWRTYKSSIHILLLESEPNCR